MAKKGTYYTGRVQKLGVLDNKMLIESIKKPVSFKNRGNAWTFIDVAEYKDSKVHYVFGKLSKYSPKAEVGVVDEDTNSAETRMAPNLLVASSPFIYIPEHSGIAFLNISNHIEARTFISKFKNIIEQTNDNFFVDCDIELISDLKTFATKLSSLQGIHKLNAKISPPNPLFGPLWKSLNDYLEDRNTDHMSVVEDAPESESINTKLQGLVESASTQTESEPFVPDYEVPIGDAAILMAADGYGKGFVKGKRDDETVIIRTSETAINFSFDKNPEPESLYLRVVKIFEKIANSRHMRHGD